MRKTSNIILVTIVATCILLGLGYAAISNITLNIAGSASAVADQANFKVRFTGTPVVSDSVAATASITSDHAATISVQGLTTAGQYITATYEVENESQDLSADLKVETTNDNLEYFMISSKLEESSLKAGESTTVLVTVKLTKTPIDGDVAANIGVGLTAMPVEPGKEGTSVGTNDFSSTPINKPLNEYGFYYGEAYTYTYTGGLLKGYETSIVFYEEGYAERYSGNDIYRYTPAEQIIYSENSIKIIDDSQFVVSDNGYKLTSSGNEVYNLDVNFMDKQEQYEGELNEYGFHYDVPYVMGLFGSTAALEFNENSTISWYEDGIYCRKEKVIYAKDNQYIDADKEIPIYENGKIIIKNDMALKANSTYKIYDYVYITKNGTTGEYIYLDEFPDVQKENDMYAVGDYLFTYINGEWKCELLTNSSVLPEGFEVSNREKEEYHIIIYDINGGYVTDLSNVFAGCTNLVVAPKISNYTEDMSGMFDGCTSLTTAPALNYVSIRNMTNAFRGCTSLEGEISICCNDVTEYAGCFEGVDMSKITLTGTASNATKNKLGRTGLNYVDLPEDE